MTTTEQILTDYGKMGVILLREDVSKVSATGETEASIRFEVGTVGFKTTLRLIGRKFFSALETGRGPRKSSEYQEYDLRMYDYLVAKGIGSDLSEKKRRQLARFLTYKINKEGDSVFKSGGRVVYSPTLTKLIAELKTALTRDFIKTSVKAAIHGNNRT